ncbi:transposase [Amycolatopsis umgeniensis]|uniref:Transposase n=1 Tax=Amycolatopsis umgeniensis TaxID=336628 RepID=A0A841AXZ6_9PSEU|nr:transposase [Amycolatopsis umgeniensis]MBB5851827.1 transposase [Amycolatopsis umgeniensis]
MASTFSREFKSQIVELFRQGGRTFKDIAEEFDLSATTVSNWVREDANSRGKLLSEVSSKGDDKNDKAEIVALKRQLQQKEEELEILGKALAFFARRKEQ